MLDSNTRGILEKIIDEAVIKLSALLFVARANKSAWHIQKETDYVIGVAPREDYGGLSVRFCLSLQKRTELR
jgi:hypothetical protein